MVREVVSIRHETNGIMVNVPKHSVTKNDNHRRRTSLHNFALNDKTISFKNIRIPRSPPNVGETSHDAGYRLDTCYYFFTNDILVHLLVIVDVL